MTVPAFIAYSRESAYKRIDHKKQLFLDNDVVGVVKNVKRGVHEPAKLLWRLLHAPRIADEQFKQPS